jgi:hypothetical protein
MCCKLLAVAKLAKPIGAWCQHCDKGRGCKIYDERPDDCQKFYCGYLQLPSVDERWRPDRCKFVIFAELDGNRTAIHVDPGSPRAWRAEPFYSQIKEWSVIAADNNHQVVVYNGNRCTVVFPHEEVDLGVVHADEHIITRQISTQNGIVLEALKLKADDPQLAGTPIGKPFVGIVSREK